MRADLNFKTPDALHLAAAIEGGCARFLTNDTRLNRCSDIVVEVLP
jgi:predicted nucleic acid-binding protein